MVDERYKGLAPGYVGVDYVGPVMDGEQEWITKQEIARNKLFNENFHLYKGKHGKNKGGPFSHPYGSKGKDECILYVVLNVLGEVSEIFADLVLGNGFTVNRSGSEIDLIKYESWKLQIHNLVTMLSYYGFMGMQPYKYSNIKGVEKIGWIAIKPCFLFYDYSTSKQEIDVIYKRIPYEIIQNDKKTEYLYEEVHLPGRIEYHFYEIIGTLIIKELDLSLYTELIDKGVVLDPVVEFANEDFFITLIANNFVDGEFISDYSDPAKTFQESLNGRVTREDRVLDIHSNPKLIMPLSMAEQSDSETGKWTYDQEKEVLFYGRESNADSTKFLTWEGQLVAAKENRDFSIQALCLETGMTPTFLSFHKLIGNSSAETYSKLELMSYKTKKRVNRKQDFLIEGLNRFFVNYFWLKDSVFYDVNIDFVKTNQISRETLVNEIIDRKQNNLISAVTAIMILDDISFEEAQEEVERIMRENDRAITDELNFNYDFDKNNNGNNDDNNNDNLIEENNEDQTQNG